ncbi:MAG: three-Cys-motif partner protein TcmP, partial [Planctomycetes bacterium]|nr:three-Cys-motif partner protein TcmP [Planctomycetota bacterium]
MGSPLGALTTLLDHNSRDALLAKSTVDFLFIERDKANVTCLRNELSVFEPLPKNVSVFSECGDSFDIMQRFVESVEKGQQLAPSFVFVDPYGFKIPGRLLRRLLQLPQVELFVNVIWRELDMAISQGDMMPP